MLQDHAYGPVNSVVCPFTHSVHWNSLPHLEGMASWLDFGDICNNNRNIVTYHSIVCVYEFVLVVSYIISYSRDIRSIGSVYANIHIPSVICPLFHTLMSSQCSAHGTCLRFTGCDAKTRQFVTPSSQNLHLFSASFDWRPVTLYALHPYSEYLGLWFTLDILTWSHLNHLLLPRDALQSAVTLW